LAIGGRPRSVAFLPDGSRAYVPSEGNASVTVIDTVAHRVVSTIPIQGASVLPMHALVSPDGGAVFVSTGRGNSVAVIDPDTNSTVATIPVGSRPWGIALSPDGQWLFSANGASNDVSV